ncbi:hypothetical protein KKG48_00440 [Patescibacteria group bacterium]|nr:hypothetical protein [Patescibacteria group bacterium]MCG2694487.1 hypothetical protein [Candidatus Parcubacteria bacterium]
MLFFNDNWIGFYYPDKNDLTEYKQSQKYKTVEECRDWVDSQVSIYNPNDEVYDYECGKNCKKDGSSDLYICKETTK